MINLKIGQRFTSQSKIQSQPVEYIYRGQLPDGQHCLEAASGIFIDDCVVETAWFDNRNIKTEVKDNEYENNKTDHLEDLATCNAG
jgi:hypothetical protein